MVSIASSSALRDASDGGVVVVGARVRGTCCTASAAGIHSDTLRLRRGCSASS